MVKCPFCHYDNEDGALFCEQCKSDLALAEPPPAAEIVETAPVLAIPDGVPLLQPIVAEPVSSSTPPVSDAVPVEAVEALTPIPLAPQMPVVPSAVEVIAPVLSPDVGVAPPVAIPLTPPVVAMPLSPPAPACTTTTPIPVAVAPSAALPAEAQPRLIVLRGLKRNVEYPLYEGHNFIGRAVEKPVDIDLDDQEPPDRVWSSRQHALITFEGGQLIIEDLNSSNGTFVNRARIYPGQKRELAVNDVIQIGTVQMKLII